MFGRIATTLKRLMGFQSSPASEHKADSQSNIVKPSRAKSGRTSKAAQGQQSRNQSAQPKPRRKSSLAQAGTTELSRKPRQKAVQPTLGETGLQQATPASQPASKSVKRKPKAAQQTTAVKSRKPAQKPAQTTSGKRGRPRKTPA